jgi:hypothetical protein
VGFDRRWVTVLAAISAGLAVLAFVLAGPAHVARAGSANAGPPHAGPARADGFVTFRLPRGGGHGVIPDAADFAESAPGRAPLLVFLPATGAAPQRYRLFLETAHSAGYSVLGLDYPDTGPSLARSCQGDMACYGEMLANRFDGQDPSRFSRVRADNAILHRLRGALAYLSTHDAAGGWDRYRTASGLRWSDVVLAGHSQGGSEAAYMAHLRCVRGVLMFSAPAESVGGRVPAWLARHSATPPTRMWALDDAGDVYAARIAPSWRALGITAGRPRRLPRGAHGLVTTLELGTPGQAHGRVVSDRTPLGAAGEPVLQPVWRWMLRQSLGAAT